MFWILLNDKSLHRKNIQHKHIRHVSKTSEDKLTMCIASPSKLRRRRIKAGGKIDLINHNAYIEIAEKYCLNGEATWKKKQVEHFKDQ